MLFMHRYVHAFKEQRRTETIFLPTLCDYAQPSINLVVERQLHVRSCKCTTPAYLAYTGTAAPNPYWTPSIGTYHWAWNCTVGSSRWNWIAIAAETSWRTGWVPGDELLIGGNSGMRWRGLAFPCVQHTYEQNPSPCRHVFLISYCAWIEVTKSIHWNLNAHSSIVWITKQLSYVRMLS